jgi:N-acyl homoserine lactone hydrolase
MLKLITKYRPLTAILFLSTFLAPFAHAADKPVVTELRVYILDGGEITFSNMAPFSDTGEFDGKLGHLSDMSILVAHPKGWLLWDTGVQPKKYDGFEFTRKRTISSQLADIGLKPEDITYLAFSHFHCDHTGNANEFLNSTWILQNKEWQWANSQPTPFGVDPSTFSQCEKVKKQMIDGDCDVFGDGKVKILSVPGHTPGHEALLIKLDSGKNVIFTGDLYHQALSREKKLVPAFNTNRADTLASIDRVDRIAKNLNAKLFIQHEKGNFEILPPFPKYLK